MSREGGCKVDVVTDAYDLQPAGTRHDSFDDYLLSRWIGADGREPVGYRTLADEFNRRLLKQVYDSSGRDVLAARLESDYETLTSGADLRRGELEDHLAEDGIDAERLRRDMISWGTMATHLKECLGGEKPPQEATTEWERRSIEMATDRAETKIDEAVSALASKGELSKGNGFEVELQTHLRCADCETRAPLSVVLNRGYVCESHR